MIAEPHNIRVAKVYVLLRTKINGWTKSPDVGEVASRHHLQASGKQLLLRGVVIVLNVVVALRIILTWMGKKQQMGVKAQRGF